MQLQIGDVSESVSVEAAPPLLATTDATVGQVIGPVMMSQLPLNDRNYLQLALLSPGTGTYGKSSFYNSALTDNAGSVISGSAGEDRNAFSLDGADIKSYLINGSFVPSIEAVEEFKIETTPYSAELGTSPGAQILLITKNGTNQLHGSAYEFVRNSYFDAKNYFDNPDQPIPELRKNQFGATIGGPIVKRQAVLFRRLRRKHPTHWADVLRDRSDCAAAGRQFLGDRAEHLQSVVDCCLRVLPERLSHERNLPNNTIPASLDQPASAAAYLQSFFPLPTTPGLVNNYSASDVDRVNREQFNIRVDYARPKDSIFGRVSYNNSTLSLSKGTFNSGALPGFGDNDVINTRDFVLADDHTFNPSTVLDVRVSFFRQFFQLLPKTLGDNFNEKLGIQGVLGSEPFNSGIAGLSNPGANPYDPEFRADNQYEYSGKLTKLVREHSFTMGINYARWQVFMDAAPSFPQGQFNFDGTLTADPNNSGNTGNAFADFCWAIPSPPRCNPATAAVICSGIILAGSSTINGVCRPGLTLNLGIRWEFDGPFYEKYNRLSNFDPNTGQLIVAGRNGVSRTANVRPDWNNFAPRVGFAYSPSGP